MTFVLPSDADPTPGSPTPVPSSSPDFLAQLSTAQQADARLSQMSDADLHTIAAQGSSGAATGSKANFSDFERVFPSAPPAPAASRNFADVERAFAGPSNTQSPGGPTGPHLESDDDVGLNGGQWSLAPLAPAGRPKFVLPSDELTDEQFLGSPTPVGPDVAKSAASGISTGVQGLIGMGGDIRHAVDYSALWAEAKIAEKLGQLPPGQTADDVIAKYRGSAGRAFMSNLGFSDTTADVLGAGAPTTADVNRVADVAGLPSHEPQTTAGKYAYTIGSFLPGALATPAEGPLGVLGNAVKFGVIPGAASEAAGEATAGTGLEPWARTIAGVGAGVGSDLAATGTGAAWNAGKNLVRPLSREGQQDIAATKLQGAFTDPDAARAELAKAAALQVPGAGLGEIVPGSRPTTGQLTGDLGALSLERELATKQPDLAKSNVFGTGSEQQNAARTAALNGIQPTGSPEAVGNTVRQQMAAIEASHDAAVTSATADAQNAASGIGTGAPPEDVGANLRSTLQGARDSAKTQERQLWSAVDPDGTLALPANPISSAASSILSGMPKTAKPLGGETAAIFDTAQNLPAVSSFSDVVGLRKRLNDELRAQLASNNGVPNVTHNYLSQLRGSVEDAITNAATHKAAADQAAVASGEMAPAEALNSRINDIFDQSAPGPGAGQNDGARTAQAGAASAPDAVGSGGARGQGTGRPGNAPSGQAISGDVAGNPSQTSLLGPGKVYHPGGALDVNYEVVPLARLITSHDSDFRANPRYPTQLQPRARDSAPARDQVTSMAARLEPERLGRSPEANSGAPIVGPDNVVESGNGRTLALGKAYGSARAGDYRNWLQSQGVDTAGIQRPILIARRVSPLTPEERIAFTHGANTSSGLRMNAAEQAAADARLITPDGLASIADGSPVNSAENRTFVRSFLSQLPASERGGMLDSAGNLSQAGVRRLQAAMASRAYGDGEFVARAFDAADPNIRGLAGGMTDASGAWMKMRQAAREGVIDPDHDITPDLMNAARAVMRARAAGRPVSEVLNQRDMFGGETSALAKRLILNDKGNLASREQISARLQKYAGEAQKNLAGPGLFGDTVSPTQVLKTSLGESAAAPAQEAPVASAAMKPGPVANLDAAAAARLKAASAATKARASTFDIGPVGAALRKSGNSTDYKMADSSVPGQFWKPGPNGAENVQAYREAAGAPNMDALHDAAAESLRRDAMTPDGVIDPGKFAAWQKKYADALRELPPDLRAKFSNAASASDAVADAAEARKGAIDGYQKSVAGKFLGLTAPEDVTKTVSGIFGAKDAVRQMSTLSRQVGSNPEAAEGLRKAVADAIMAKAKGTTESGTSGIDSLNPSGLKKFLHDNAAAIKAAGFSDREFGSMLAVAQDLQRGQRTLAATRLPGQSNTAQDIVKSLEAAHGGHVSLLTEMMVGMGEGLHVGGLHGAALAGAGLLGKTLVSRMREAGIAKANALVRDAMLNPELAATLLKRAPIKPGVGIADTLTRMLARNSMFATTTAARESNRPEQSAKAYATGGRVAVNRAALRKSA